MASTFTPNANLEEPQLGDYVNDWQLPLNANFTAIDNMFGGMTWIGLSGSNVNLTTAQAAYAIIVLTGSLSSSLTVSIPSTISGKRYIWDRTNRNGYTIFLQSGASAALPLELQTINPVLLLQGAMAFDPGFIPPGTFLHGGGSRMAGALLCDGSAVSRVTYAGLFAKIGTTFGAGDGSTTFNLPNGYGRVLAGQDGGTGLLYGWGLGMVAGEAMHTLTAAEVGNHNHPAGDLGHGHSDSGHAHISGVGNFVCQGHGGSLYGAPGFGITTAGATAPASANIQAGYATVWVGDNAGGAAHNNVQPTLVTNIFIKY
jgi:microcystin-dependent protein